MTQSENSKRSERMRLIRWVLKALISLGLIAVLLIHADLGRISGSLASLSVGWLLIAVLIKGTGILAGVIRWKLLMDGQDLRFPVTHLGGAYLIGRFFGSFLPSTIGLDVYRTYYASVRTRKVAECVAVTGVEKVIGLFSLSALALASIPFGMRMLPDKWLWMMGIAMCAPIGASTLVLAWPGLFLRIANWLKRRERKLSTGMARAAEAVGLFGRQRGRLMLATLLGLIVHAGTASMYIATARAVGVEIPATEILFIGPLMIAATLVPLSIAGIGVREGVYAFFLVPLGVPAETAVLLGFLGFLAGEVYSLLGGAVWLFKPASRPDADDSMKTVIGRITSWARRSDATPQPGEQGAST